VTGQLLRTIPDGQAFSGDGNYILSKRDETLNLWDAISGRLDRAFKVPKVGMDFGEVALSPDGSRMLRATSTYTQQNPINQKSMLELWDTGTRKMLHSWPVTYRTDAVAFSPDGRRVLAGNLGESVKEFDAVTGRLLRTYENEAWATSVAFSSDGHRVVLAFSDNTIKVWDTATGHPIRTFTGHSAGVTSAVFSPDGTRVLSSSLDTTIKSWNVETGELVATFIRGNDGEYGAATEAAASSHRKSYY
jgi:WD40 repeat protein